MGRLQGHPSGRSGRPGQRTIGNRTGPAAGRSRGGPAAAHATRGARAAPARNGQLTQRDRRSPEGGCRRCGPDTFRRHLRTAPRMAGGRRGRRDRIANRCRRRPCRRDDPPDRPHRTQPDIRRRRRRRCGAPQLTQRHRLTHEPPASSQGWSRQRSTPALSPSGASACGSDRGPTRARPSSIEPGILGPTRSSPRC